MRAAQIGIAVARFLARTAGRVRAIVARLAQRAVRAIVVYAVVSDVFGRPR